MPPSVPSPPNISISPTFASSPVTVAFKSDLGWTEGKAVRQCGKMGRMKKEGKRSPYVGMG
jgi:hypothetical protein